MSERTVHSNPWLKLNLADVELPDGRHLDHYVLRQRPVAATVVVNERDEVLLLWRHRFITDTWGWEVPAGVVDEGETTIQTAAREAEEETGWRVRDLRPLLELEPAGGLGDCVHHVFVGEPEEYTGPPADAHESESVKWIPLTDVPALLEQGEIPASTTATALLYLYVRRRQDQPHH
ncbi:MAG: NUDIX hydrolase [Micromonosporaceae bacterium]